MATPVLAPLPPTEAVAFFRGKGLLESFAWQDVWQEEHAKAFTVAKAMRRDILQDIYEALDRALADGTTVEQFKKELTPILQAKGWWGRQEMADPLTGEIRNVQLGSSRRLDLIAQVNMRSSYAAGQWERIERTKASLPFLLYDAVQDGRTRPEHRAWDGTILPVDDPWWDTHYPPCGWRCRCGVIQLTAGMLERRGLTVTDTPPRGAPRPWRNPRTGETIIVETGIDPGFAYNVGKAHLRALAPTPVSPPTADGQAQNAALVGRPAPASDLLDADVERDEALAAFLAGFDLAPGESRIWRDAMGEPLAIDPGLFLTPASKPAKLRPALARALPLIGRTLRDPDEIWQRWMPSSDGRARLERVWLAAWDVGGRVVEVAIGVSALGWWAATSGETATANLSSLRPRSPGQGVVVWRRPAD